MPITLMWLFAIVDGIASGVASGGPRLSSSAELVASYTLSFLLSFWVITDARERRRCLCYDFDSFVFLGWPLLVPVYLFQTRGIRALWTLLLFVSMWLFAWGVAMLVSMITFR